MSLSVSDIRADLKLMEASGTNVFFRYTTEAGDSQKTPVMSPEAATSFLDTMELIGQSFAFIWMGREEQF